MQDSYSANEATSKQLLPRSCAYNRRARCKGRPFSSAHENSSPPEFCRPYPTILAYKVTTSWTRGASLPEHFCTKKGTDFIRATTTKCAFATRPNSSTTPFAKRPKEPSDIETEPLFSSNLMAQLDQLAAEVAASSAPMLGYTSKTRDRKKRHFTIRNISEKICTFASFSLEKIEKVHCPSAAQPAEELLDSQLQSYCTVTKNAFYTTENNYNPKT